MLSPGRLGPSRRTTTKWLVLVVVSLCLTACADSTPQTVAVVDGVELSGPALDGLRIDGEVSDEERALDLNLLVLHQILVAQAADDFDLVVSDEDLEAAVTDRLGVDATEAETRLRAQGTTMDRTRLESELDVIRERVELAMVETDEYGFDFEAAYRSFLGVNARVCLRGLRIVDPVLQEQITSEVDAGATVDKLFVKFGDGTETVDLGCTNPVEHGTVLAPVALDGDIGTAYVRETDEGTVFVVEVTERDSPPADEVRDEVMQLGRERQAPELFDKWAVAAITAASVTIDESVGSWKVTELTGDVPTVVPA